MSRTRRDTQIRIENPLQGHSPFTSLGAADRFVERGAAHWTIYKKVIRFRDAAERVSEMNVNRDMERDRQYWNDVARERGGESVSFEWRPSMSANGYNVMGARVIAVQKC